MKINFQRFFELHKYSKRKLSDYFLIEGKQWINIAKQNDINMFLYSVNDIDNYEKIEKYDMKKITGNHFIEEIGVAKKFNSSFNSTQPIFVFNNLSDFGNIGSIIRTIFSFGFSNIIFTKDDIDIYNHKVIESSRGLFFKIKPLCCTEDMLINMISKHNLNVITVDLNGINLEDFNMKNINNKTLFIFGNETIGISEKIKNLSNQSITIPICFESLNVGVATGIVLYKLKNSIIC